MKMLAGVFAAMATIFLISQSFDKKGAKEAEQHAFKLIESHEGFELREYRPATFAYMDFEGEKLTQHGGTGYRYLASYAYGDNERTESIDLTAPVYVEVGEQTRVKLMMPRTQSMASLPIPRHEEINFVREGYQRVAVIAFTGWVTDERIAQHKDKLLGRLAEAKISHRDTYAYVSYNPPHEVMNRQNEVMVYLD